MADVAVPRRGEMMSALLAAIPFAREAPLGLVDLGAGDGAFAQTLLDAFPSATILALDGSEAMRTAAAARLARFGGRARVGSFQLDTIDWWDRLDGCDVAISSLCLHHLNDSKTQFLYKAVASRLSARGAFLIADQIDPMHPAARRLAADAWDEAARQQAQLDKTRQHDAKSRAKAARERQRRRAALRARFVHRAKALLGSRQGGDGQQP